MLDFTNISARGGKLKKVLISVYNKRGVENFAKKLVENNYKVISTGGTSKFLQKKGLDVTEVSEITGVEEMLGGRVKTLHPKIFGGILAREEDEDSLIEQNIPFFDMVVCNLYPFEEVIKEPNMTMANAIENIDIGGVALLRAAAKNFERVIVVSDISDYDWIIKKIETDGLSYDKRLSLAKKAFLRTSKYDTNITNFFAQRSGKDYGLPLNILIPLEKTTELRYGENPHQKAGLYLELLSEDNTSFKKYQGKALSYNNLVDIESAYTIVNNFEEPTSVIMKHTNPCGIGKGKDIKEAYERALSTDPMSAFGGIIGFNRTVTGETASIIVESFKEVIIAPSFEEDALEIFRSKKNLRVVQVKKIKRLDLDYRRIFAGWLIQERDKHEINEEEWEFVSKEKPNEGDLAALRFAWKVVGFVKSNAIVITDDQKTIGIGAGQMSRIDAVELAAKKAMQSGLTIKGTFLASDGFFPFRDSIDFAAKKGIKAVIEPGGSIRDKEVIEAANEKNIILVFSHRRHFRH